MFSNFFRKRTVYEIKLKNVAQRDGLQMSQHGAYAFVLD